MVKVAFDAGHGIHTPGKRSPNGEREWTFNDKVIRAAMLKLSQYKNVEMLRTDDSSGNTDVPLSTRTNRANAWKADILVSAHHNALGTKWDDHEGAETFVMDPISYNPKSKKLANCVHPHIVKVMKTKDRGIKSANFHMLRESKMPAILTEGGFMDSRTDIKKMRDDKFLRAQGEAIAVGIAEYFGLELKVKPVEAKPEIIQVSNPINAEVASVEQYKKVAAAGGSLIKGQEFVVENKLSDGTYPERPLTRAEFWETLRRYDEFKK